MALDPVFLSRLQFAWVIGWHILLPAFTVGLAAFIALLECLYLLRGDEVYRNVSTFLLRIFSVAFGMGVVTGVIMPFQFGTNWSRFADATANVIAPLFAYEGLTAFFLESAFLGVLLFGRKLVPKPLYFLAALMVAGGTLLSSFWILAVNSWMQTPAGFEIVDGRFFPVDWTAVIFNPSFIYRLAHTVTAFFISTAFIVAGVGAWTIKRRQQAYEGRVMLSMALWLLTALVPLQALIGDLHGVNTLKYQPAKLAAIEGLWEGGNGVSATLFALPSQARERNFYEIAIPRLASLYLTHSWNGEVKGLKDFPVEDRPPVAVVFFAFRIMVGCALLMLVFVSVALCLRWQARLYDADWFLLMAQWMSPIGLVAVIAGWTTTEVGRQPWTVYGLMRTADSVPPSLTTNDVMLSLTAYVLVYLLIYPSGLLVMARLIRNGPVQSRSGPEIEAGLPSGPIDALAMISKGAK